MIPIGPAPVISTSSPSTSTCNVRAEVRRHLLVVRELHREYAPVAGHSAQVRGIGYHLCRRHKRPYGLAPRLGLRAQYLAPPRVYVPYDVAELVVRNAYLHLHDGLEDNRVRLLHALLEAHGGRYLEGHLG